MPPRQPEQLDRKPSPRYVGILFLILLVGLPVVVMSGLFVKVAPGRVVEGAQPGGVLRGRVVDNQGRPLEDINLVLWLATSDEQGGFSAEIAPGLSSITSDSSGRFELNAPAHEGHYDIVAEGDLWVGARKSVTFFDRDGGSYDPGEIEITLEPGCHLIVEIVDSTGAPAGSGEYRLRADLDSGPFFGLLGGNRMSSGTILNGVIDLGGLPPMEARFAIELDNGKTVELMLSLVPGIVSQRIQL